MKRLLFIWISFILLSACSKSENKDKASTEVAKPAINIATHNAKYHTFSDPATKDIFLIQLIGDSVQTATVTFEIKNSKGKLLYTDTFAANYLLNYDLKENATSAERDEFILNRVSNFFAEENFRTPAIKPDMNFDPNYADEKIWNEVKADTSAIGFYYLLGKEDGRWLAYSKTQQKVVLYFNCC